MELKRILKIMLSIVLVLIIIDQFSKIIVDKFVEDKINCISNVFVITKIENEGIAFGMNKNNLKNICLMLLVLTLIIRYVIKQKKFMTLKTIIFISFIIAGGISNLVDRVFRGAVLDFIKVGNFPIFNLADIFIVLGWILFIINIMLFSFKEINKAV